MFLRASFSLSHSDISLDTNRSRERRGNPGFTERSRERHASETAEHD